MQDPSTAVPHHNQFISQIESCCQSNHSIESCCQSNSTPRPIILSSILHTYNYLFTNRILSCVHIRYLFIVIDYSLVLSKTLRDNCSFFLSPLFLLTCIGTSKVRYSYDGRVHGKRRTTRFTWAQAQEKVSSSIKWSSLRLLSRFFVFVIALITFTC